MSKRLEGRVAIVTGASRGIGEEIARQMAREGAKVVLASRKEEPLQEVAAKIKADGGEAFVCACHVGKDEARKELMSRVIDRYGQVDVLVNNAATNPHFGPMLTVDWGAWDKTFEVNLKGYFGMTRLVAQHLQSRKAKGSIIQIASIMGLGAAPMQGVYGMTKAAVVSMTQTLAVELGSVGIRLNAIAPGLIETKFADVLIKNEALRKEFISKTALNRLGQPPDIASAAVFLASDEADYMTGQVLVIDGGWSLG